MAFDADQDAYIALRNVIAERTEPVVAWVGSGLSVPADLPSWNGLKNHLLEVLRRKASSLEPPDSVRLSAAAGVIREELNPWIAMEMLAQKLEPRSFRDEVKRLLTPHPDAVPPAAYEHLWRLPIRGLLTLNLDRLAMRALSTVRPGMVPNEFSGRRMDRLSQALLSPHPFVINLHGEVEDRQSWVLTSSELRSLTDGADYKEALHTLLRTRTVIFIGISIDDEAVGGHLQALSELVGEGPTHYWLTNRRDSHTDAWAERLGVRLIRYRSVGADHSELDQVFADLLSYVPQDDDPPPVAMHAVDSSELTGALPSPREILAWPDADTIRKVLNAEATRILSPANAASSREFEEFCATYNQAIHRAWFIATEHGENQLLGYELLHHVESGAFGQVYRALNDAGEFVAIKVLRQENRSRPDFVRSFRRGVRSMQILHANGIKGMVRYEDASEIPAFVAMEWVDGPNLAQAKNEHRLHDWHVVLRIARELVAILRSAHALPERVLHRDVRPANIMLRPLSNNADDFEVVVLDFDLSWHRDAQERSVLHTSAAGYLAPEQIHSGLASTRNAAVDSFGIGMTLFFLCHGQDPVADQHLHAAWNQTVGTATKSISGSHWRSLPARFARLILRATQHEQAVRWDLSEISGELTRLWSALGQVGVDSAELIAEEIAANSETMSTYEWDESNLRAMVRKPYGLRLSLSGDEGLRRIKLTLEWSSAGDQDWRSLAKYLRTSVPKATAQLRSAGWRIEKEETSSASLALVAIVSVDSARTSISALSGAIDRAILALPS